MRHRSRHNNRPVLGQLVAVVMGVAMMASAVLFNVDPGAAADTPSNNPYASSTITKIYDGTGFPTDSPSYVNAENGYYPGDNGPDDGVVSSNDLVGYEAVVQVKAGLERTFDVSFDIPQYLTFDLDRNRNLCLSNQFITGSFTGTEAAPKCTYTAQRGTPVRLVSNLTLVAKDTLGIPRAGQVASISTTLVTTPQQTAPYSTDSADPVTVVSAPAADLLLRPQGCSVSGSCAPVDSSVSSLSFFVDPTTLSYDGYASNKGLTSMTPWTATFVGPQGNDSLAPYTISGKSPDGTGYSVECKVDTCVLPETVGTATVTTTQHQKWTFEKEDEPGSIRDFAAHIEVPDTAFAAGEYKNNGDGWEPGQDGDETHSTFKERGTNSRSGYRTTNNDYTILRVYKVVAEEKDPNPGYLHFTKTLKRPWDDSQTMWEPGNTQFGKDDPGVTATHSTGGDKVTEGTEVKAVLKIVSTEVGSDNYSGHAEEDGSFPVAVTDQWDPAQFAATSTVTVQNPAGEIMDEGDYYVQWSPIVPEKDENIAEVSEANDQMMMWVTSDTPIPNAAAVRVVFKDLPIGVDPKAGTFTVSFVGKVIQDFDALQSGSADEKNISDYMWGWPALGNEAYYKDSAFVVPLTDPVASMGLKVTADPASVLDMREGTPRISYTYTPNVGEVVTSESEVSGQVAVSLDPCITSVSLRDSSVWTLQNLTLGSCSDGTGGTATLSVTDWQSHSLTGGKIMLPAFTLDTTVSRLAVTNVTTGATWLASKVGEQTMDEVQASAAAETSHTVVRLGSIASRLITDTPEVEHEQAIRWQAVISGANVDGQSSHPTQTVIVLPGGGDDRAYLDALKKEAGGPGELTYDGATESDFNGNYTASAEVAWADSVAGTQIECTTYSNPALDPSFGNYWGSCDDVAKPTALRVTQPGGDGAGISTINITLVPTGNQKGDVYLTWIGPVTPTDDEGPSSMAWPVQSDVVAFDISGYLYWDQNGGGNPYSAADKPVLDGDGDGVVVTLKKDGAALETVTADSSGHYKFADLDSGVYTVEVEQGEGSGAVPSEVSSAYGSGTVDVYPSYSYNYRLYPYAKLQTDPIEVGVGKPKMEDKVNFGFWAPDPHVELAKMPAKAVCPQNDDTALCDISWDVIVKNNTPPRGVDTVTDTSMTMTSGKVIDNTSEEVSLVTAEQEERIIDLTGAYPRSTGVGGTGVVTNTNYYIVDNSGHSTEVVGFTGDPLFAVGDEPFGNNAQWGGSLLATTDGFWAISPLHDYLTPWKIEGTQGVPVSAVGARPFWSYIGDSKADRHGSALLVTNDNGTFRYWAAINFNPGEDTTPNFVVRELTNSPTGTFKDAHGSGLVWNHQPGYYQPVDTIGVATSTGYWMAWCKDDTDLPEDLECSATLLPEVGIPAVLTESFPKRAEYVGVLSGDKDKFFIFQLRSRKDSMDDFKSKYAFSYEGTPIAAIGDEPGTNRGFAYITTSGLWVVTESGQTEVTGFDGTPQMIAGGWPGYGGLFLLTDEGIWGITKDLEATKLSEPLLGNLVAAKSGTIGYSTDDASSGLMVATTEGVWSLIQARDNNFAPVQATLLTGRPSLTTGTKVASESDGVAIATNTGLFNALRTGTQVTVQETAFTETLHTSPWVPVSEEPGAPGFITRQYKMPDLAGGEETAITLKGKIKRKSANAEPKLKGLVVGNQAWYTAKQLSPSQAGANHFGQQLLSPIPENLGGQSGNLQASLLELLSAPTLDKATLPAYNDTLGEEYSYGFWEGNDSCVNGAGACGQVYAQVPPSPGSFGAVSGKVWYDNAPGHEGTPGQYDSGKPVLKHVQVFLYKTATGTDDVGELVDETWTDQNGEYLFKNVDDLAEPQHYRVVFDPGANPIKGDGQSVLTGDNQKWGYSVADEFVVAPEENKVFTNANGITPPISVPVGTNMPITAHLNAAINVYETGLSVEKGYCVPTDGETGEEGEECESIQPQFGPEDGPAYNQTIPVVVKVTNSGTDTVSELSFVDTTLGGSKNVAWDSCQFPKGGPVALTGEYTSDGIYTFDFDADDLQLDEADLQLDEKEYFTCSGTLEALGIKGSHTDQVAVSGVTNVTRTAVGDDATFNAVTDDLADPVPGLTVMKGILDHEITGESPEEMKECEKDGNTVADGACWVTDAKVVGSATITFRVTNTGDENLWDPNVIDQVTVGDSDSITGLNCPFSTGTHPVTGQPAKVLYASQNADDDKKSTVDCTATLTMDPGADHQDKAYALGVGEITKQPTSSKEVTFNAVSVVTAPALPKLGGMSAVLFAIRGLVVVGIAASLYVMQRVQRQKQLK